MAATLPRAILRFVFPIVLPAENNMGLTSSRERTQRDTNEAAARLYSQLKNGTAICPFSGKRVLPSNALDEFITAESVREAGALPRKTCRRDMAEDVFREAKKIFAILVTQNLHSCIGDLFSNGLNDTHLPLEHGKDDSRVLVGADGTKFYIFQSWDLPIIDNFMTAQYMVQAPVFGNNGRHFDLAPECGLPLQGEKERIGDAALSEVYKCTLHPGNCEPDLQVSLLPSLLSP